jgi:glucosamine-phosphate N-acetyltransferase
MEQTILVRLATKEDILTEEFTRVQEVLSPVGDIPESKKNNLAQTLTAHPYYTFIAIDEGMIVGSIILFVEQKWIHQGGLCGHLETLTVLPNQQGKGVGSKLIKAVVEKARELGCYKVILDCKDELVAFYEKNGFNKQGAFLRKDT